MGNGAYDLSLNYHHRLLMGFSKVIVINMNLRNKIDPLQSVITVLKQSWYLQTAC